MINSASDEGMHKDHSSVMGKGAHNNTQLTELVVAASRYQIDMWDVVAPWLRRSLSTGAAVVFVHAFVTSRIDHSCSVLVGLPLGLIGRVDRVLRSAARLIGHISKICLGFCLHA